MGTLLLSITLALAQEPPAKSPEEIRQSEELLLQKLANPLAALASLSTSLEFDYHIGPGLDGHRTTLFARPTIPVQLSDSWTVLSRTIVPVIYQEEVLPGGGTQAGVGDVTEAAYLATMEAGPRGWVGGIGPIVRFPTGSEELLTSRKWSAGPTLALVKQQDEFTYGLVASQLWSFAGSDARQDLNLGVWDMFLTYRTTGLWNLTFHLPLTYDFNAHDWTVPLVLSVEKLVSFQSAPVTISFGVHYWAESPDNAPHDLGFQFGLTLVFPK